MANVRHSTEECVEMMFLYGKCNRNVVATSAVFHEIFPIVHSLSEHCTSDCYQISWNGFGMPEKILLTGSFCYRRTKLLRHPGQRECFSKCFHPATRRYVANMSANSVNRVLKRYKQHPYKCKQVQELHGDDFDRRKDFCHWFITQEGINPVFAC